MITLDNYLMGRSEDPKYKDEYSDEIKDNALILINKVNSLLQELGITEAKVSSGWRPPSLNATIANAAKKSAHQLGMAVDLADPNKEIYKKIEEKPELLKKYGLWLEHKDNTPTWTHLDTKQRSKREIQIFKA